MKNISVEQVDLIADRLMQGINPICVVAIAQRLLGKCGLKANMSSINSDDVLYAAYHNEYANTLIYTLCALSPSYPDQQQDHNNVLVAIDSAARAARTSATDVEARVMERMRNGYAISPAAHEPVGPAPTTEEFFQIISQADYTAEGPIA